ncbi:MAG: hypothetical protein BWY46_01212 [Firmicutes bacterium ADurb.Bin300]|nr:MAG: hypothetical protein BWY46_01212 [Firmicutes bacterium ADurb.Bin300]HOD02281.1 hypothetical protein [Clostridiales bacterium]
MAKVTVKLFGVMRLDSKISGAQIEIERISDIFNVLNENIKSEAPQEKLLSFNDAVVFVNGERCKKKSFKPSNGDEIWLMSPSSGG